MRSAHEVDGEIVHDTSDPERDEFYLTRQLADTGHVRLPLGVTRIVGTLTVPDGASIEGAGYSSNVGVAARTSIVNHGDGPAITLGSGAALRNLSVEAADNAGDTGVVVAGTRSKLEDVSVVGHPGSGIVIAGTNSNLWRLTNVLSLGNGGHGIEIDGGAGPNANAGLLLGADLRSNGGDGLAVLSSIDNQFFGLHAATNTGWGVRLAGLAEGHYLHVPYCENNGAGTLLLDEGADDNVVWGTRSNVAGDGYSDLGNRNLVMGRDNNTGRFTIATRLDFRELVVADPTISGAWSIRQSPSNRELELVGIETGATNLSVRVLHDQAGTPRLYVGDTQVT